MNGGRSLGLTQEDGGKATPQVAHPYVISCAEEYKHYVRCRWADVEKSAGQFEITHLTGLSSGDEVTRVLVRVGMLSPIVREAYGGEYCYG